MPDSGWSGHLVLMSGVVLLRTVCAPSPTGPSLVSTGRYDEVGIINWGIPESDPDNLIARSLVHAPPRDIPKDAVDRLVTKASKTKTWEF